MTVEWRLLCRKRNQPKPPQVLMNYSGLGKDNDLSVFAGERGQAPGGPEGVTELQKKLNGSTLLNVKEVARHSSS